MALPPMDASIIDVSRHTYMEINLLKEEILPISGKMQLFTGISEYILRNASASKMTEKSAKYCLTGNSFSPFLAICTGLNCTYIVFHVMVHVFTEWAEYGNNIHGQKHPLTCQFCPCRRAHDDWPQVTCRSLSARR
jgi:hypothetical protein